MRDLHFWGSHTPVFLAVASQGSISEAAKVLGMTQSSVSYHLSELEKTLKISLFDRRQKPIGLTSEGKIFYRELYYECSRLGEIIQKLQAKNYCAPSISFGIIESLSYELGIKLASELFGNTLNFEIKTGTSEYLYSLLDQQKLDWVIASKRPQVEKYNSIPLFREPSVLVIPEKIKLVRQKTSWEELQFCGLPFLRYNQKSGGDIITESILNSLSVRFPNRMRVDDGGVMLRLIKAGLGWSFLRPATLVQHREALQGIKILPMPEPVIERRIMLVHEKSRRPMALPKIREICEKYFLEDLKIQILHIAPWLEEYFASPV